MCCAAVPSIISVPFVLPPTLPLNCSTVICNILIIEYIKPFLYFESIVLFETIASFPLAYILRLPLSLYSSTFSLSVTTVYQIAQSKKGNVQSKCLDSNPNCTYVTYLCSSVSYKMKIIIAHTLKVL